MYSPEEDVKKEVPGTEFPDGSESTREEDSRNGGEDDPLLEDDANEESESGGADGEDGGDEGEGKPDFDGKFCEWMESRGVEPGLQGEARSAMEIISEAFGYGNGRTKGATGTECLFELVLRSAGYVRAVKEAETRGEVRGRNASIEELMELRTGSDGVPHPGTAEPGRRRCGSSIFDLARQA